MKKEIVRYSEATKKNALSLLSKGWTVAQVAKKHNTSIPTIHYWKKQYPELAAKSTHNTLFTETGNVKNGLPKVKHSKSKKKLNTITITLSRKVYEELLKQAKEDIRTSDSQAKFYILNGIRNHHCIPF